jgi:hypothetical protein
MSRTNNIVVLTTIAVSALLFLLHATTWAGSEPAANQGEFVSLAQSAPQEVIFHAMAASAVRAYTGLFKKAPASLGQLATEGFMPYNLPVGSNLQLFHGSNAAKLSSGGALTNAGVSMDGFILEIKVKQQPPAEWQSTDLKLPNGEWERQNYIKENVPGGRWLLDGHDPKKVSEALKIKRIRQHLTHLAVTYCAYQKKLPGTLSNIEEFQACGRNSAAWAGVTLVSSLEMVDQTVGAVYVGRLSAHPAASGAAFVVRVNTGLGIEESGVYMTSRGTANVFGDPGY